MKKIQKFTHVSKSEPHGSPVKAAFTSRYHFQPQHLDQANILILIMLLVVEVYNESETIRTSADLLTHYGQDKLKPS